ncbi:transposase (plasmid) [Chondrinema litorale]|nr:transposase [Chondrinema litorale]UZR99128.1 transposase [Chondrinema litorale]
MELKIAISNHRIQGIDHQKKQVIFTAKDYKKGGKKTTVKLSTKEFVRRFTLHILPKGFTRIRHYGILSSSWKKGKLPQLQIALATKVLTPILPKEPLLHRQCPSCKTGRLHTVLLFDVRGPPKDWQRLLTDKKLLLNS